MFCKSVLCAAVVWFAALSGAPESAQADCVDDQTRITSLVAGAPLSARDRQAIAAELRGVSAQTRQDVCAQAAHYVARNLAFRNAYTRAAERARLITSWRFSNYSNGAQMRAVFAHDPLVVESRAARVVITESMVRARALQYRLLTQAAGIAPPHTADPAQLQADLRAGFARLRPGAARVWMQSESHLLETAAFLRTAAPAIRAQRLRRFADSYNAGRLAFGAQVFAVSAGQDRRFNRAMQALGRSMTVDAIRRGVRDFHGP